MAGSNLSKRLSYVRAQKAVTGPKGTDPSEIAESAVPREWRKTGKHTYRREYVRPFPVPAHFQIAPIAGAPLPADKCLFFDTETTGLSGGAGTTAFLIGIGRFTKEGIRVIQFFLSDFPGEAGMLRQFLDELKDDCVLISYNGKAFDSNLLRTRCILQGLRFPELSHVDLLYPARRLWKNLLDSCSLGTIESSVLGVARTGDIPGRDVPDYYFRFLKERSFPLLEGVFRHNVQDILSLAELLLRFHNCCEDPFDFSFIDRFALGRMLLDAGDDRGTRLILEECEKGNTGAALYISLLYKRRRLWEKAAAIWKELFEREGNDKAGIELAKYYEHIEKKYERALDIVSGLERAAKNEGAAKEIPEMKHRRMRLETKIADC